jgi:membrane protein YdbS with pleckstrin-like domain
MTLTRRRTMPSLTLVVFLVIGVVVASRHHYFATWDTWRQVASAVLAVALWPLILLGIDLHIKR